MPEPKSPITKRKPSNLDKEVERMKKREGGVMKVSGTPLVCKIHNVEFDMIPGRISGVRLKSCPLCRKEREEELKQQETDRIVRQKVEQKKRTLAELMLRIDAADIPPMFKDCALDTYHAENDGQKKALQIVSAFISKPLTEAGPGLLMRGNNGNGKTHLATSCMNDALKKGYTALYTRCWHIFNEINDARNDPARSVMTQIKAYTDPDILVIDELGVQSETAFELKALTDIFDTRYAALKPTIICGNADKEAVDKLLGPRILDRYAGGGHDIRFNWGSHRRKG